MLRKSRGILYLAFGEEFEKLAVATATYSRQFTDLPICILTNRKAVSSKWSSVSNTFLKNILLPTIKNRTVKVSLLRYTPFDETLFMDADAVIQKSGIETVFQYLDDYDLACQHYGVIKSIEDKNWERAFVEKTYLKLAKMLGEDFPIHLYSEAAVLFRKTDGAKILFDRWEAYWKRMGSGRDMPAFSFAVKHTLCRVKVFTEDSIKFCKNVEDESALIQHKGFAGFEKKFKLPAYKDWNPKL